MSDPAPVPVEEPQFDKGFDAPAGALIAVGPGVRRILAPNPGPFTFHGTCTYVVGTGQVAVLDPGPDDPAHLAALRHALRGETVSHIVITHTHRDHSPGAKVLAQETGATIVGCDVYRPKQAGIEKGLDASHDRDYAPAAIMQDGDILEGQGWQLEAIATPGHAANHLCFALRDTPMLFSGDHVMAWSTTIVAPPDGSMADYMRSLDRLRARAETLYWPGHGGPVREPQRFVRGLAAHRRQRETAILKRLAAGDQTIQQIVPVLYVGVPEHLHGAAGLSVFSHLDDLVTRGVVKSDRQPSLTSIFTLA
ncbi:MAG: MBL fold metallo-hydrolase [Beijerinckiaceae bacterium]